MNWRKEYGYGLKLGNIPVNTPDWIVELAVRYENLRRSGGLRTETEFKMHRLCVALDVDGVKAISEVWKFMVVRAVEEARAAKRALPKVPKVTVVKSARPTAKAVLLQLFAEEPVRTDAQIIAAVQAATFHDGFNQSQLAWYRSQFRKGAIKGQGAPGPAETAREARPAPKKAVSAPRKGVLA